MNNTSTSDIGEWHPGDGICPPTTLSLTQYQTSHSIWMTLATTSPPNPLSHLSSLLDPLKHTPPFFHNPPPNIHLSGASKSHLILRSSLHLKTTDDETCDQTEKSFDYLQCLGFPGPRLYNEDLGKKDGVCGLPGFDGVVRTGYLIVIILAWSYISPILAGAGLEAVVLHDVAANGKEDFDFWDIVTKGRWVAKVKRKGRMFFSPWMLRGEKLDIKQKPWTPIPPNPTHAFNTLTLCTSHNLEPKFLLGFASILLLTSRELPPPTLAPPVLISSPTSTPSSTSTSPPTPKTPYNTLLESLPSALTLSSTQDALDSLLTSAFFTPDVPYPIKRTDPITENTRTRLLCAISNKSPRLALLWSAAVFTDQAGLLFYLALDALPPICLVGAFMTGVTASFVQTDSDSYTKAFTETETEAEAGEGEAKPRVKVISRAKEFQTSFFCRPAAWVPWTPAPPFGTTPIGNLSLDVRAHLGHGHRPVSWRLYWILKSGMKVPASETCLVDMREVGFPVQDVFPGAGSGEEEEPSFPVQNADENSFRATSTLFNWHRGQDDGLWLDDGDGDVEAIRRVQKHPWIVDPFFDDGRYDPVIEEEDKSRGMSGEDILAWRDGVEIVPV